MFSEFMIPYESNAKIFSDIAEPRTYSGAYKNPEESSLEQFFLYQIGSNNKGKVTGDFLQLEYWAHSNK